MTSLFRLAPDGGVGRLPRARGAGAGPVRSLPPPGAASRHSRRAGDPNQAAELVVRVNQLEEELRQANGRIEELENAEHRLETRAAEVPPGRRIPVRRPLRGRAAAAGRRRSAREPRPSRRRRQGRGSRTRSIPTPIRTRPARRGRSEPRRRARRWCARRRRPRPVSRSSSARPPASNSSKAPAARKRTDDRRLRGGDARSAARAVQRRAAGLSGRAISGGGSRVQGVSRRQSVASAERRTRSSISARPIFSAPARARRRSNISRSRPTIPSRRGRRRAWCGSGRRSPRSAINEQACATLDGIRQALPVRVGLGEEARRA